MTQGELDEAVRERREKPAWIIAVTLNGYGEIIGTIVYRNGSVVATRSDWSDRHTLGDVVVWANRSTYNDYSLTARDVVLV